MKLSYPLNTKITAGMRLCELGHVTTTPAVTTVPDVTTATATTDNAPMSGAEGAAWTLLAIALAMGLAVVSNTSRVWLEANLMYICVPQVGYFLRAGRLPRPAVAATMLARLVLSVHENTLSNK